MCLPEAIWSGFEVGAIGQIIRSCVSWRTVSQLAQVLKSIILF